MCFLVYVSGVCRFQHLGSCHDGAHFDRFFIVLLYIHAAGTDMTADHILDLSDITLIIIQTRGQPVAVSSVMDVAYQAGRHNYLFLKARVLTVDISLAKR